MSNAFRELLMPQRITEVVDIGANPIDGDPPYTRMLAAGLCRVTGFEPQDQALAALQQKKGPNERYLPYAVGDGKTHTLNICRALGTTSLLEPDPSTLDLFGELKALAEVMHQVPLATRKLDDISEIQYMDFLKIDIQGGELAVFQGGTSRLSQAVAIQTEVSFIPLYKNQPGLYHRFGIVPPGIHSPLFCGGKEMAHLPLRRRRRPAPAPQSITGSRYRLRGDFSCPESMTDEQLKHLALIAHHCYGSIDLALRCLIVLLQRKVSEADGIPRYVAIASAEKRGRD